MSGGHSEELGTAGSVECWSALGYGALSTPSSFPRSLSVFDTVCGEDWHYTGVQPRQSAVVFIVVVQYE